MQIKKEAFKQFKETTMLNGGDNLLKKSKEEVVFNPGNPEHMSVAKLLLQDMSNLTTEQKSKIIEARRAVPFTFKLEAPWHDLRNMIYAKVFSWAVKYHSLPNNVYYLNEEETAKKCKTNNYQLSKPSGE